MPPHGVVMYRVATGTTSATTFSLRGTGSGRCVDAVGGVSVDGTAAGTRVIWWACGSGTNQRWTFQPTAPSGAFQSGKCLDVREAGTGNNSELILWTCSAANNQRWTRS